LAQSVDHLGESAKRNCFVGAKKDGVLRLLKLGCYLSTELVNVNGTVAEIDALVLVDGDDEALLIDFFYGRGLGDVDFDAGLQDRGGDHENDEQHENNVNERDHVDLGERALRVFRELRHSVHWPPWAGGHLNLHKSFFDLSSDFQRERVEALRKITDILQKLVVEDNRWDGDEKTGGGGNERFSDTWCDGAQAGCASISKTGKGVNDAPHGAEEADERSYGAGCGQPGHTLFDATNFFRGSELHANGDGLEALQFSCWLRIAGANLAQEFAIAGGIDGSKRRTCGSEGLRIGYALGGAKDAEELVALTANAAEHAKLLKDHGPGNDGKNCEQEQNAAGNPARLSKNVSEIGDKNGGEQKNGATPQLEINFPDFRNVAHAYRVVKQMRCGT